MVENKQIMARNILHYMSKNNLTAKEVCQACGFKQNTFSDWVHAKTYPRIDKIEAMANYFKVNKSCLVEAYNDPDLIHVGAPQIIDKTEDRILNYYRKLNGIGKKEAERHMEYLCSQEIYIKNTALEVSDNVG